LLRCAKERNRLGRPRPQFLHGPAEHRLLALVDSVKIIAKLQDAICRDPGRPVAEIDRERLPQLDRSFLPGVHRLFNLR
jgi:hypothetical protein